MAYVRGIHCNSVARIRIYADRSPFGGSGAEPGGGKPLRLERDIPSRLLGFLYTYT